LRILSLTHGPSVPGGVFEHEVEERGHALERWSVPNGDAPGRPESYDAVMVFGGAAHPDEDDRFTWLRHEAAFLRTVLAQHVPVIGVCLGAQMLARAAGASVRPASEPEIGWYGVEPTPVGRVDPVLSALPESAIVFQWHRYTYDLPAGGVELARSPLATQAFRLREQPAWGIQFHAEVRLAMVTSWIDEDPDDLLASPGELLGESRDRIAASNKLGRSLCAAFLAESSR